MQIHTDNLGKRYSTNWIFRHLNLRLESGGKYSVTGPNGSGKSTLLQILAGINPPSQGKISFAYNKKTLDPAEVYQYLSITAPYLELPEELTLSELLSFHFKLKPLQKTASLPVIIQKAGLEKAMDKQIRYFSSGMKQRVKLLLVFYTDVPLLFLDEPTSNLDAEGIDWYKSELNSLSEEKVVLIFSNQPYEYEGTEHLLHLGLS